MSITAIILSIITTIILIYECVHNQKEIKKRIKRKDYITDTDISLMLPLLIVFVYIVTGLVIDKDFDFSKPVFYIMCIICYLVHIGLGIFAISRHNGYKNVLVFDTDYIYRLGDGKIILYEEIQLIKIAGYGKWNSCSVRVIIDNKRYEVGMLEKEYEDMKRKVSGDTLRLAEMLDNQKSVIDTIGVGLTFAGIASIIIGVVLVIMDKISEMVFLGIMIISVVVVVICAIVTYLQSIKKDKKILEQISK